MPPCHPSDTVAAELARLAAVADAREAAAAASLGAKEDAHPYVAEVARRARAASDAAAELASSPERLARLPPAQRIPRVHCCELSLKAFREEYCAKAKPVVITGLGPHLTEDGEHGHELGWLKRHGSTKKVAVTRDNAHVNSSLRCADTDVLNLGDHLARVLPLDQPNLDPSDPGFGARDGDGTYLYDCAVPLKLPSLMGSIRVPRYFAHDFLQRTRRVHAFTASWPSLFVAAPHTRSSLHVDQWQGNFWMAMVKGTKRWSLFHADDIPYLSPDYSRGTLDPSFPHMHVMDAAHGRSASVAAVDEGEPEAAVAHLDMEYPLLPYARRYDVDLGPGEVLFVPGGWPHVVHNLDVTVSFAGNYVDESNLDRALDDLKLLGCKYGSQMVDSFEAIDEVWFDPEDEVMVPERLEPKQLVVRYEDYYGGKAGTWGAKDWDGVDQAELETR